jgi:hypothetical protein
MGCWITFRALDVPTIYQRLFDAPDAATREAIFSESLVTPFMGVVQQFGGEGLASFAQWGMRPDHFAPEHAARTRAVVAALSAADAWITGGSLTRTGLCSLCAVRRSLAAEGGHFCVAGERGCGVSGSSGL